MLGTRFELDGNTWVGILEILKGINVACNSSVPVGTGEPKCNTIAAYVAYGLARNTIFYLHKTYILPGYGLTS